jgi:putative oxidoreductase
MAVSSLLQRLGRLGLKVARSLAFLAPLLTRVTVGYAFALTGWGKLTVFHDNLVSLMSDLGIPFAEQQAWLVGGLEFVGGIALILGLGTRLFATALLATMLVAILTAERAAFLQAWLPTGDVGPLDIAPYVFFLLLSWLALYGPGPISLDRLLAKRLGLDVP